jgi:hypothetical protein
MTRVFSDPHRFGQSSFPHFVEGPKLLRMAPDVGEDALSFLNTSGSLSIGRTEIWPDRSDAFEDA